MAKLTNTAAGPRGINMKAAKDDKTSSETLWIEPGATVDCDEALIFDKALPDGVEKGEAAAKKAVSPETPAT